MYYIQRATPLQRAYYQYKYKKRMKLLQRACYRYKRIVERSSKYTLPLSRDKALDYQCRYKALSGLYAQLFPYTFAKPTDHVVQVSSARSFISTEVSQPLIFSTLTKQVTVFEAEPQNVITLRDYSRDQLIDNIDVIESGVYSHRTVMEFQSHLRAPSGGALTKIVQSWHKKEHRKGTDAIMVSCDSLDNLLGNQPVDILNITINGTENEALQGASKMLEFQPNMIVMMPLIRPDHHLYDIRIPAIQMLHNNLGYNLVFANAPQIVWVNKLFICAVATRQAPTELEKNGCISIELDDLKTWQDW